MRLKSRAELKILLDAHDNRGDSKIQDKRRTREVFRQNFSPTKEDLRQKRKDQQPRLITSHFAANTETTSKLRKRKKFIVDRLVYLCCLMELR